MGLALYGDIFYRNVIASGVVPQISLILGNCAGGHVYSPALTDFNLMVDGASAMMITGPDVIKTVTGEDITIEDLGGARAHNSKSGVAHFMSADEDEALELAKALLSYLPSNNLEAAGLRRAATPSTRSRCSSSTPSSRTATTRRTTCRPIIEARPRRRRLPRGAGAVGAEHRRRLRPHRGPQRRRRRPTTRCSSPARSTSTPPRRPRASSAPATPSTSRSLTFVDVPGFLPGVGQEHAGIIRRGAKLLYAYSEATVPLVTVITRKAYGGAYVVMGSKHLGADVNLAWPTAQVAVVGAQGAVNIVRRKEIAAADGPRRGPRGVHPGVRGHLRDALHRGRARLRRRGHRAVADPPRGRQGAAAAAAASAQTLPPKKHGNIPL